MAFFISWLKRYFISQEMAKNAQKEQKNDQKSALLTTDFTDFFTTKARRTRRNI